MISRQIKRKGAAKIRPLRRAKFAGESGRRLPFHEIRTDLVSEPSVQMVYFLWPVWKCKDLKGLGIGSDDTQ